jgi:hypothetical protein
MVCISYTGGFWADIEPEACSGLAETTGEAFEYMPEGCPIGAHSICILGPVHEAPTSEIDRLFYEGIPGPAAEAQCDEAGGTYSIL